MPASAWCTQTTATASNSLSIVVYQPKSVPDASVFGAAYAVRCHGFAPKRTDTKKLASGQSISLSLPLPITQLRQPRQWNPDPLALAAWLSTAPASENFVGGGRHTSLPHLPSRHDQQRTPPSPLRAWLRHAVFCCITRVSISACLPAVPTDPKIQEARLQFGI